MSFLSGNTSHAQSVNNYSVSRSTGITYNSIITTGSSMPAWRYTGAFSEDDNRSEAADIGFDFWYNGVRYTQFSISTNGFLDFSSSVDDGGPQCDDYGYCNFRYTDSSINNGTWLALAPFYDDMTTGGGVDPLGTSIKYQLSGSAPYRVLTVEWDGMAVYQNTTPDVNFQVKLYESTGVIDYNYETMDAGTNSFSYTIGINAASISNPPTTSELLTQQTANSSTFSNSIQNNLSTMPTANSRLQFTPLTPANPMGGILTFTGITNTGMTLNWTDWASNEVGYVIYYSTNDVDYYYNSQTVANASSATISNLLPSTTYYWRVYAVTEGTLSSALSGNATTLAPGTVISASSNRWDDPTTWDCNCIPTAADNVIIQDGHNVRIRSSNIVTNDLTIGEGTSGGLQFRRNTARDLTVNGDLTISSGATLDSRSNSNTNHTLNVGGDLINNGTMNLQVDANSTITSNFVKQDGHQSISGSGSTNHFFRINIDKGQKNNTLEIISTNFSCDVDALSFTGNGTFKFSSAGANSFSLFDTNKEIPINGKIWMNSTNSTMSFGTTIDLRGELVLDAGTVVIGDAVDENITSFGGKLVINGGNMNLAGRYTRNDSESTLNYTQTNGTFTLPTIGSTSTTEWPFNMDVTGSSINLSGGSIIIEREGGNGAQNLGYTTSGVTSGTVTDGILQIGDGNTPAAQVIQINTTTSIGNILLNSANATALLTTNDLDVLNDVTLTTGVLDDGGLDIDLLGDWLATGGSFTTGTTGTVTFDGTNQSITTAGSAFNHLILTNSGTKSFQDNLDVNGNLTNDVTINLVNSGFQLNLGGNWTNNGSFNRNNETLILDGAIAQTIGGSSTNDFTNITVNKSGGTVSVESDLNLYRTLDIQTATTLDVDGSTGSSVFTLISNATDDSRIGALATGASITGDLVFEKYFNGQGIKYWRHISSAVVGSTLADLQAEIPISGTFTGNDNGKDFGNYSIPSFAQPSLYYYDNTIVLQSKSLGEPWVAYPTSINTELLTSTGTETRGYAIWVRETGAITYDLTGRVNQGNLGFDLSGSNVGWKYLGNPYPSDIDWDAAGWTKTDIQGNAVYVWNGTNYLTWNGTAGTGGFTGLIAKGQGFWVQAASPSVALTATESVKTASQASTYRTFTPETTQILELNVAASGFSDQAIIQFLDTASYRFDIADAPKLNNLGFNLATLSTDSTLLSINAIAGNECSFTVPIALTDTWQDQYLLNWNASRELLDMYQIYLEDQYTSESYDLNAGSNGFNFSIDSLTDGSERLVLNFTSKPLREDYQIITEALCDSKSANLKILNTQFGVNYDVKIGDSLISTTLATGEDILLTIDSTWLESGINQITVYASRSNCSPEVSVEQTVEIEILKKPVIVYDEINNLLVNESGKEGLWYLDDELFISQPSAICQPDSYLSGVYTFEVSSDICSMVSNELLLTGIEESLDDNLVSISPNPTTDFIDIDLDIDSKWFNSEIEIYDPTGKIYYKNKINSKIHTVKVTSYDPGVYIIRFYNNEESRQIRFIKL